MKVGTMRPRTAAILALLLLSTACDDATSPGDATSPSPADTALDVSRFSPTVDHPYVAFAAVSSAVFEGEEVDEGETIALRVESTVREETTTVAGIEVTIVDVLDHEDGELVERTEDYYAQHTSGDVYYLGERVDEIEDGEVVGHGGQWLAGEDGNRPGLFMPADPRVGAVFEQEQAPGVAEDRSEVVAVGVTVTVPAGTFEDCIETEDLDPIDGVTERKVYCPDVGLVQEQFPGGGSLDLVEFSPR